MSGWRDFENFLMLSKNSHMKKIVKIILLCCILFSQNTIHAYGWDWEIDSFESNIVIQEDSSIIVTEKAVADFSREEHHGYLAIIPIRYKNQYGHDFALRFKVLEIKDENGTAWPYEEIHEGDNVQLKIGDPVKYLNKPSTFIISYKIERAITQFDDHKELYWNVTGNEGEVQIENATSTITLPNKVKTSDLRAKCYTGKTGSSEEACSIAINGNTIKIAATRTLNPLEGLTIVVGFPKDAVANPGFSQEAIWFLADNWGYILPVLTFGIFYYIWLKRGRDPKINRNTIVPMYTPPDNLRPSEIGAIIDERVDIRDITSSIIDFAVRGYLEIIEKKEKKFFIITTEYEFKKLKDFSNDSNLESYEKQILEGIFDNSDHIKLSDLKNKFYEYLPKIRNKIYEIIVKKSYFPASPEKTRQNYLILGIIIIAGSFLTMSFLSVYLPLSFIFGSLLSGGIIIAFSKFMPAKTKKGVEVYYKILGLEEFINTAEKDRMKFQEKENIFEKLLPYAMALGVAEKWTKAFEGLYINPPNWYKSSDTSFHSHFSSVNLYTRLNRLSTNMSSTFVSSPRSSGSGSSASRGGSGFSGGFSGGGFGGGSRGAW